VTSPAEEQHHTGVNAMRGRNSKSDKSEPSTVIIQFPILTLFLLTATCGLLAFLLRWLLWLPSATAFGIVSAAVTGISMGVAICVVTRCASVAKAGINVMLVAAAAFLAICNASQLLSYGIGLLLGITSVFQGVTLINELSSFAKLTISPRNRTGLTKPSVKAKYR